MAPPNFFRFVRIDRKTFTQELIETFDDTTSWRIGLSYAANYGSDLKLTETFDDATLVENWFLRSKLWFGLKTNRNIRVRMA